MKKWFSRHYQATETVIYAREVSLEMVPAHFPSSQQWHRRGKPGREQQTDRAENPRWPRQLSCKGNDSFRQREFWRCAERCLQDFGWLLLLMGVRKLKRLEKEQPERISDYSSMPSLTQNPEQCVLPTVRLEKYHDSGDARQSTKGLTQSWELLSLKSSTVLGPPNKS